MEIDVTGESAVAAYDALAHKYDLIESFPAFMPVREASLAILKSTFRQGQTLIDIGCGSGTEAIALAKAGCTVVGIDPSEEMIKVARQKANAAKMKHVSFHVLHARDLYKLPDLCGFHRFDGAYSSLGSLNCEPLLEPVKESLIDLLHPGSRVVLGLTNRWCISEMAVDAFTAPSRLFRRSRPFMRSHAGGTPVSLRMFSVGEAGRAMKPFRKIKVQAISAIAPPPTIGKKIPEDILQALARVDASLGRFWPVSRLGDYVILTFTRD